MKLLALWISAGCVVAALGSGCTTAGHVSSEGAVPKPFNATWNGSAASELESRYRPVVGRRGMVVSDSREASEWGAEILREGGNAVDAAVATAFALAVTRPQFASLGGGGFMIYCPRSYGGKPSPCSVIDYRETAPAAATRDMYVRNGKAVPALSRDGALASGVPGVTAGLLFALREFGILPRAKVLVRPIQMAVSGIRWTGHMQALAQERWNAMNAAAKAVFGCKNTQGILEPCKPGTIIRQQDLSRVLGAISNRGSAGFYRGWVGQRIAWELKKAGGIITQEDLIQYQPKRRKPVEGDYRGLHIVTMPPPSAGGVGILQMLEYAELADSQGLLSDGYGAARTIHALTYGMSLAFADRAELFGDPDFVHVPVSQLLSPKYLRSRWAGFDPDHAKIAPASPLLPELKGTAPASAQQEGRNTTHFCVIDAEGNAVAVTTTINNAFGSGFVVPGTGIVMNDEMDDFSAQPGAPNLFGLVQAESDAIAPGKRPLSSMAPTIVRDEHGSPRLVIGAQGGPRITTSVFLALLNRIRFGMSLPDAIQAPRFHHQWKPGTLMLERSGFSADTLRRLERLGYRLKLVTADARMQALERFPDGMTWGVSDLRTEGAAVAE